MSRPAGSSKAQVEARQAKEQVSFNLRFCLNELEITRLRIAQALRRDPGLADLLEPGAAEIDQVMRWLAEVTEQIQPTG